MFPLVSAIVNHKRDKWIDAVGKDEIKRVHDVLDKLHAIDPNKKYKWPEHLDELKNSDIYTLRRITGRDRGFDWGDK